MSELNPKEVRENWLETHNESGMRLFCHPTIRRGTRPLQVFASDIDADNGDLVLMGKYLIPIPDVNVEGHKLLKVGKVWVTKYQAQSIFRLMGEDFKRLFRMNIGSAILSFAARVVEGLVKGVGKVIDGPKGLVLDTIFQVVSKGVQDKIKDKIDGGAEFAAEKIREIVVKWAHEANPVIKELVPEADLVAMVEGALAPVLVELKDLFN